MWKKKVKIFVGILLLLIGVLFLTGVVFLFGTKMYVRNQIQKAMTKQIQTTNEGIQFVEYNTFWIELDGTGAGTGTGTGRILVITDVLSGNSDPNLFRLPSFR